MVPCRLGRHLVDRASQLSPELWARIFHYIESDIRGLFGTYPPDDIWDAEQKPYRRLQLVCKTFRDVFAAVPALSEAVAFPNAPHTLLPSLLAWLRSQSSSVRILAAEGSYLDVALASLGIPSPPLQNLMAWEASPMAMAILPIFTSLQSCDLFSHSTHENAPLDLSPLQALPRLQQLHLKGSFCNLHAAAHLTSLWIYSSSIVGSQQDCRFASTLRKLTVFDSDIQDFHSSGLCACMALECLSIRDSVIGATQGNETLQLQVDNQFHIPDGITSLTSLADVTVHPQNSPVQESYEWLFVLASLTALYFNPTPQASLTIPGGLTKLQRLLQRLAVTAPRQQELDFPTLTLQVNWDSMLLLKQVKFTRQIIVCDRKILQFYLMKSLVVLKFTHCVLQDKLSGQTMACLAHSIALHNPHLDFVVDKCNAGVALPETMQSGTGS